MNLRKDNNGAALEAWKNTAPGHIAKPLRHIGMRTNAKRYKKAITLANRGQGEALQRMARSLRGTA